MAISVHGVGDEVNHLIVDAKSCLPKVLDSMDAIYEFLSTVPTAIGSRAICLPCVTRHDPPKLEDAGITGFVIIADSHVSIHTFPQRGEAFIDIYSCKPFPATDVAKLISGAFGGELDTLCIVRAI